METIKTLDVTILDPRSKHATIFQHIDALADGSSLIIFNDHDPKPLYYQLVAEKGNTFIWEYLENGPDAWQVKITKIGSSLLDETVGQIASSDIRKADVFKKLGIDFCCGGKKTLRQAIREKGISEDQIEAAFENLASLPHTSTPLNFSKWSLDFLIDYIVNVHHQYVRENGPIISGLADKVANRHGDKHPELFMLAQNVHLLLSDLYQHLEKEEDILFPAIKDIANHQNHENPSLSPILELMELEHESAGNDLKNIRKLTNDYHPPFGACNSYIYLFEKLNEFESDLYNHIHLENNILFPAVAKRFALPTV